jgi:hypothetical protein
MVWNAITDEQYMLGALRAYHDQMAPISRPDTAAQQLDKLRRREQRALEILNDPDVSFVKAKADLLEVRSQIAKLTGAAQIRVVNLPKEHQVKSWCAEIRSGPQPEGYQERRAVLEQADITVRFQAGEVEVEGRCTFPSAEYCLDHQEDQDNKLTAIPFKLKGRIA